MTAEQAMAEAASTVEKVGLRINKLRQDGRYYEAFVHSEPDVVSPVVIASFADYQEAEDFVAAETWRRRMQAALAALAAAGFAVVPVRLLTELQAFIDYKPLSLDDELAKGWSEIIAAAGGVG